MCGERHSTSLSVAAAPNMGGKLRIYMNIPGLNRATSQELLWPSCVGRSGGCPRSYACMLFGLLNMASTHQRYMQGILAAHKARCQATLMEEALHPREPPRPPEPPEAQEPDDS